MKKSLPFTRRQSGFSLVELIIAGVLMVGMLLAGGVFMFSGDNSRATNIFSITKELGDSASRFNSTTGLNPKAPVSLFDKSKTTTTDTHECIAVTTWQGPYINGFTAGTDGVYPLDAYVSGATATFAKITTGLPSGSAEGYEVVLTGLPETITRTILGNCNGVSYTAASTLPADHSAGAQCAGSINATTKIGTVKYLYVAK